MSYTTIACHSCRKRRLRCGGDGHNKCEPCEARGLVCEYALVSGRWKRTADGRTLSSDGSLSPTPSAPSRASASPQPHAQPSPPAQLSLAPDDDPQLTADARLLLLRAFVDAVPRDAAAPVHPLAFLDAFGAPPVRAGSAAQQRPAGVPQGLPGLPSHSSSPVPDLQTKGYLFSSGYAPGMGLSAAFLRRTLRHPVLEHAALLAGARSILQDINHPSPHARALPVPPHAFARGLTVRASVARLEKRLARLLGEGMARFFADAAEGRPLRTPDYLALQVAMFVTAVFVHLGARRVDAARAYFAQLAAMWRMAGICGDATSPPPDGSLDGWIVRELSLRVFWVTAALELSTATRSMRSPVFSPGEFSTVAFPVPDAAFWAVAPPDRRDPAMDPDPADLLRLAPPFRAGELFSWLDPVAEGSPGPPEAVLRYSVTEHVLSKRPFLQHMLSFYLAKFGEFSGWLRDVAGLQLLEVIAAEHLVTPEGPADLEGAWASTGVFDPAGPALQALLGNPYLPEAVRRRQFLQRAADVIEEALPEHILTPLRAGDVPALLASLPRDMERLQVQRLLSNLCHIQLAKILVRSPEPFHDRPGSAAPKLRPELLAALWHRTRAFLDAAHSAILVSHACAVLARFPGPELRGNLMLTGTCRSAAHAAWFHLLAFRRLRGTPGAAQTARGLLGDAAACLSLLEKSGRPEALVAAGQMRAAMAREGEPSREEVEVMLLARTAGLALDDGAEEEE